MPIQIAAGETDDPQFITLLNSLVCGLAEKDKPQELWIIQIDNWFDYKWLRFSGIGIVPFQFPAIMKRDDGALDEFYQDKVTFPPFTPNVCFRQGCVIAGGTALFRSSSPAPPSNASRQWPLRWIGRD
jgi:hypothetical protein